MKKLVLLIMMGALPQIMLSAPLATFQSEDSLSDAARGMVADMAKENFDAVNARMDDIMKSALPAAKLRETWKAVTTQVGAFKSQGAVRKEKADAYDVVYVTCQFEKLPLDFKFVFNANRQVAGMFIVPSTPAPK